MTERQGTLFLKHTQIIVHWTDGSVSTFPLGESTRIGRGTTDNDIAVPEIYQSVSRKHLEIRHEKEGYRLIDLGSRNGVLVNGIYAKDMFLRDGDEIRIGQDERGQDIRIEFQLGSESFLSELAAVEFETLPPAAGLVSEAPLHKPHFKIRWYNGKTNYFPLEKEKTIIGRSLDAELRVPDTLRFVSSRHAEVLKTESGFVLRDLNSTNGTLLNNQLLQPEKFYPLGHESIIRLGDDEYGISVGFTFINPVAQARDVDGFLQAAPAAEIATTRYLLIGRLPTSDLVLDHPEVSRRHALIREVDGRFLLEDLDSSNGTYINDKLVKRAELHDGDLIQISKFLLLFQDGKLVPYQSSGMRLDVIGLSKDVSARRGKRRILDNINLSILPREFVAVAGGSGAGKSTLLKALMGIHPGEGQVRLNGHDFHQQQGHLRSQLGYLPASEILHARLTVEQALDYAARLRLPSNLTADERMNRVNAVLEAVSLNIETIRKRRIADLSDEQRKRLSIAAELLSDPKLLYLDNATSGLDPGLEKKMMHTLRRVADEGRTVLLATEATNNILQTDHIAFLSEGKLVYFGPSEEALQFFEAEEFADIYERIAGKGEVWRQVFEEKKPAHYTKYVQDRQKALASTPRRALPKAEFNILDSFRQWFVLARRSLRILFNDPIPLVLKFLLLPMMGLLQLIIATPDVLTGNLSILANPAAAAQTMTDSYIPFFHTNIFLFMMGLEALLAGLFLASNELVKERSIFLRERMVNLRVWPYLLSKVFIYGVFAIIQVALYLLIISLGVDLPENGFSELFLTLFLTMLAGVSLGLLISAVSKSTQMALSILIVLLVLQFFFAGVIFDLRGDTFEPLSYLSPTYWSSAALGVTIDMNRIVESTILCNDSESSPATCFPYPDATNDLRLDYADPQLTRAWTVLIGMTILSLAVTWFFLSRQG